MRVMYDGIFPSEVPGGAQLYAAYLDGNWADFAALLAAHPGAVGVPIAVSAGFNGGVVLDVEKGDATAAEAVDWVLMRRKAGADPTVYCSMSAWAGVQAAFKARGVAQPHYWVADYSLGSNPPIPAGAIAIQFADRGGYDVSNVADYWPGVDPAPRLTQTSTHQEETDMIMLSIEPSAAANPGIWLLSGGLYVGIDTQATVVALQGAGVQLATVDQAFHERVLAAVAAAPAAGAVPTAQQNAAATAALIGSELSAAAGG